MVLSNKTLNKNKIYHLIINDPIAINHIGIRPGSDFPIHRPAQVDNELSIPPLGRGGY